MQVTKEYIINSQDHYIDEMTALIAKHAKYKLRELANNNKITNDKFHDAFNYTLAGILVELAVKYTRYPMDRHFNTEKKEFELKLYPKHK